MIVPRRNEVAEGGYWITLRLSVIFMGQPSATGDTLALRIRSFYFYEPLPRFKVLST